MTKKLIRALPLIALAGVLVGCHQGSHNSSATTTEAPAAGTVLVTVNGAPITSSEVDTFVQSRTEGRKIKLNPEQRYMVAEQMVQLELAAQAAKSEGLADKPDVQSKIVVQRNLILANQAVENFMDNAKVSEAQLKAKYAETAKADSGEEYKARHILVKNEADAKKIIEQLDHHKGNAASMDKYFASLAKKDSTGPSAKQGGELGWFKPQQMVPAFSMALEKLKPGEYTKTPVKSQYGWHVILLQNERTATPPSYTSMKPQLTNDIKGTMVRSYLESLKSKATIHWNISNPATQPAKPATAAATSKGGAAATEKKAPSASTSHK
ncbi:MAG: peptidylprolyl isomerase [Gammaproteobacteria bacterium]